MVTNWNKEQLIQLYYHDNKTLQEIGNLFGVSRERVRQIMERFSIQRYKKGKYSTRKYGKQKHPHFKNLEDYLLRGRDNRGTLNQYLTKTCCSECGGTQHLCLHHINYPARNINDIQILCKSCHKIKHANNMTFLKQIDLTIAHNNGTKRKELAKTFNISISTVDKILHKMERGYTTYRH